MHSNLRSTIYDFIYNQHFFSFVTVLSGGLFPHPDPRTKYIAIIFFFFYIYCTTFVCFYTHFLGYAIVLLCICNNNTNVALEYQAIWWLAEQLLRVNTEPEYCKTECHIAFRILGRIVCSARTVQFTEQWTNKRLPVSTSFVKVWVTQLVLGLSVWESELRSIIPVELQQPTTCLEWAVSTFSAGW